MNKSFVTLLLVFFLAFYACNDKYSEILPEIPPETKAGLAISTIYISYDLQFNPKDIRDNISGMPVYLEQQAFSDATLCLINQYKKNVQVVFIESGLVEIIIYENYNDREEFNYIVGLYMNQVLENLSRYFKPFSTLNFFYTFKAYSNNHSYEGGNTNRPAPVIPGLPSTN